MAQFLDDAPASSSTAHDDSPAAAIFAPQDELSLHLLVRDPEVLAELSLRPEGRERNEFALTALRLGVIALRHASGTLDSGTLRKEAERMVQQVDKLVCGNASELANRINSELTAYFDPTSGKLTERLNRLVQNDGELSRLLSGFLDGESSRLSRTLAAHIGENSPLLRMLSPQQADGLLAQVRDSIGESLKRQHDLILRQFTMDDPQSALSRCLTQLTDSNGKLRKDLAADVEAVKNEFSLNNEHGALTQLVRRVEAANKSISDQFSFDNEQSAINKLSKQISDLVDGSTRFHEEVRQTLAVLQARKEEAARGTQHGVEFEQLVYTTIAPQVNAAGDRIDSVGTSTGKIPHCKKGDHVLILGKESAAPDERIVIECKEDTTYRESDALAELSQARPNRQAQVGIFVFSKSTAPPAQPPLRRVGNDVLCVWNKEDPTSDVILTAAISIARALVVRQKVEDEKKTQELTEIEDCVNRIEKAAKKLDEVETWANTIVSNGRKICEHAKSMREEFARRVEVLRSAIAALKLDTDSAG